AAVGSVLERVQLESGVPAPEGGVIARGDVAHEEEIGDFAAWKNSELEPTPTDLRQPRYDHKMFDDDFLLPPLLLALARPFALDEGGASGAPVERSASAAPVERSAPAAPVERSASAAPVERSASGAPGARRVAMAPVERSASGAPVERSASGAPVERSASGAP